LNELLPKHIVLYRKIIFKFAARFMIASGKKILLFASVLIVLSSCNPMNKLLKSNNMTLKYEKAKEYFNSKDYDKALQLLEDILPYYRATKESEEVSFFYAYCYYGLGDYLAAAQRFKSVYETYTYGKYAEQSLYYFAYCLYLESPPLELDQTYTQSAIDALQLFINRYGESDKITECNKYIDELSEKLEEKEIRTAKTYFKIQDYRAALYSLKLVLDKYPLTKYKPEIQYDILISYYKTALYSIEAKQKDRLKEAKDFYLENKNAFVNTKYAQQTENLYKSILNHLAKL
jgi:outer membrane protein assembly factor BamD